MFKHPTVRIVLVCIGRNDPSFAGVINVKSFGDIWICQFMGGMGNLIILHKHLHTLLYLHKNCQYPLELVKIEINL